jgi:hypothetical protein
MEIGEFGRLRPAHRAELEADEDDPFDAAGSPLRYRPKEHHVALREARGPLVASTRDVAGIAGWSDLARGERRRAQSPVLTGHRGVSSG